MSKKLKGIFESFGIPATLKVGSSGNSRHMWVKIGWLELDSVTLFPMINTEKYNKYVYEFESFDDYEKGNT